MARHAIDLLRLATLCALVALGACASQPTPKGGSAKLSIPPLARHRAWRRLSAEVRAAKVKSLLQAGVTPLQAHAVPAFLDTLQARSNRRSQEHGSARARAGRVVVVLPTRVLSLRMRSNSRRRAENFWRRWRTRCAANPRCWSKCPCHTDRLGNAADNDPSRPPGGGRARGMTAASMDAEH